MYMDWTDNKTLNEKQLFVAMSRKHNIIKRVTTWFQATTLTDID